MKTRQQSLNSEPQAIFSMQSVPERNTLVSWSGHYDHAASMYASTTLSYLLLRTFMVYCNAGTAFRITLSCPIAWGFWMASQGHR